MSHKKTQEQLIEAYLLQPGKSLTPLEALEKFQCFRLASVIHRLKDRHTTRTEIVRENGKAFARYTISMAGKQETLPLPEPPIDAAVARAVRTDADAASDEELQCAADVCGRIHHLT